LGKTPAASRRKVSRPLEAMITKLPVDFLRDGEATPNGRLGWSQGLHDPQKDSDFGDIMEISWRYHGDIMGISSKSKWLCIQENILDFIISSCKMNEI